MGPPLSVDQSTFSADGREGGGAAPPLALLRLRDAALPLAGETYQRLSLRQYIFRPAQRWGVCAGGVPLHDFNSPKRPQGGLLGRKMCRCLESALLFPPLIGASALSPTVSINQHSKRFKSFECCTSCGKDFFHKLRRRPQMGPPLLLVEAVLCLRIRPFCPRVRRAEKPLRRRRGLPSASGQGAAGHPKNGLGGFGAERLWRVFCAGFLASTAPAGRGRSPPPHPGRQRAQRFESGPAQALGAAPKGQSACSLSPCELFLTSPLTAASACDIFITQQVINTSHRRGSL